MAEYKPSLSEWDAYGTIFAASQFGAAIISSALYGVQLSVVYSTVSAFLRRSKEARKGHLRYIVIACVILTTVSIDAVFDIWGIFRILFTGGPSPRTYLSPIPRIAHNRMGLSIAGDTMLAITIAAGDILMWVILLPLLTFVGFIVCQVIYLSSMRNFDVVGDTTLGAQATIATISLSVAMNIMVTLLILLRLMLTWLRASKAFPDRKSPCMYSNAAAILIEAAAPLSVFGICSIAMLALDKYYKPKGLVARGRMLLISNVFAFLYYSFCSLSPQLIIYRVATGRSWKDTAESEAGGENISQPIQFARTAEGDNGSEMSRGNV
ncbi:hypothetical protein BKA70DRAFT_1154665 [Coprinopsis sp. MPI-PUGE-AT-0042]|nr:hypothetical protein BKA70DRAFT_1154665 [Coprinopsis sp. MPI-PUGE-AT-0042]